MDGYPIEEYTLDGFGAIRQVHLAWTDVDTFVSELASTDGLYPYKPATGATVYRVKVEKMPGVALSTSGGTGMVAYAEAQVTIWYSTWAPRYFSNLFYVEKVEPYREFHSVSPIRTGSDGSITQVVEWTSDSVDVGESFGVILAGHVYCLSFYRVTTIPANFFTANGYCNSAAVVAYSLGITYPAQTLLHVDPKAERVVKLGGTQTWALHYRWVYRGANSATWNHKWRAEGGGKWDTIRLHGAGAQVIFHPTVAFSTLVPS